MNRSQEIISLLIHKLPADIIRYVLLIERESIHKDSIKYWLRNSPIYLTSVFNIRYHEQIIYPIDKYRLQHIRNIRGSLYTLRLENEARKNNEEWAKAWNSVRF
tara:strand:- start:45 stop:356 length:312 start_codon:yes stop_codon:yes gene_type:complete